MYGEHGSESRTLFANGILHQPVTPHNKSRDGYAMRNIYRSKQRMTPRAVLSLHQATRRSTLLLTIFLLLFNINCVCPLPGTRLCSNDFKSALSWGLLMCFALCLKANRCFDYSQANALLDFYWVCSKSWRTGGRRASRHSRFLLRARSDVRSNESDFCIPSISGGDLRS